MMPYELTGKDLIGLYGSDNPDEIYQKKSKEKQFRSVPVEKAKKPKRVQLSAEECKALCDKAGVKYLEGYEARVIEHTVSDETVDRDGDIVRAAGVNTANYQKNPVILFAHNYSETPIGNSIKVWNDEESKSVKSWGLYFDDRVDKTGRSDVAFKFIDNGGMPACSIGFMPIESKRPTEDERSKLGMPAYGAIFEKSEMWEYSPCAVPSNPNALQNMVKSGVFNKVDCETIIKDKLLGLDIDSAFEKFENAVNDKFAEVETIDQALEKAQKLVDELEAKKEEESVKTPEEIQLEAYEKMTGAMVKLTDTLEKLTKTLRPGDGELSPDAPASSGDSEKSKSLYSEVAEEIRKFSL